MTNIYLIEAKVSGQYKKFRYILEDAELFNWFKNDDEDVPQAILDALFPEKVSQKLWDDLRIKTYHLEDTAQLETNIARWLDHALPGFYDQKMKVDIITENKQKLLRYLLPTGVFGEPLVSDNHEFYAYLRENEAVVQNSFGVRV